MLYRRGISTATLLYLVIGFVVAWHYAYFSGRLHGWRQLLSALFAIFFWPLAWPFGVDLHIHPRW